MNKIISVSALAVSLLIGGCAHTNPDGTPAPTATFGDIITDAGNYARQLCGLAPAGNVIASIIGAAVPGIMTAAALGSAICAAYAPPPLMARKGGVRLVKGWKVTPGAVNGVPVR